MLYIVVFIFSSVVEAKLCDLGAEVYYQNFKNNMPTGYEYTTLVNYTSQNNKNIYTFSARNSRTKKTETKIFVKVDDGGFIEDMMVKYLLPDNDESDVTVIRDCCYKGIGLSQSEIMWLSQHEETISAASNLYINQSVVRSKANNCDIYIHKVPLNNGVMCMFIDRISFFDGVELLRR